jgi:hypothetical protein
LSLAAVRDLRVARAPVTAEDLAALETNVLAGFVLARAASHCAISCHAPSSERVRSRRCSRQARPVPGR